MTIFKIVKLHTSKDKRFLIIIAMAILFGGAISQIPLFTSNQNEYFLPGLAKSGYGYLSSDWRVQQTDIYPVFSSFVYIINSIANQNFFYFTFIILAGIYAGSLLLIGPYQHKTGIKMMIPVLVILGYIQVTWMLNFLNYIPGISAVIPIFQKIAFLSTNGIAGQYILSPYLQPSTFGVFLILSLILFLYKKEKLAVICSVIASYFHTSLILQSGIIIFAFMLCYVFEKKGVKTIKLGALGLFLVSPIISYITFKFLLSDTTAIQEIGNYISAVIRQPHHTMITRWLNIDVGFQLGIILLGLILSFKSKRLFIVLSTCTTISVFLTLVQWITGNLSLALLFPWRASTWLIPVCSVIIINSIVYYLHSILDKLTSLKYRILIEKVIATLSICFLFGMFFIGINRTISNINEKTKQEVGSATSFMIDNATSNQTYLVPIENENFRLSTGIPIYIDWKSVPKRSSEIIEWYDRIKKAKNFYDATESSTATQALEVIQSEIHVTHIFIETGKEHLLDRLNGRIIFRDNQYIIFQLE